MKYEVSASRFDVQRHIVGEFTAKTDDEAVGIFRGKFVENQQYCFDDLRLDRVVQERKTGSIAASDADEASDRRTRRI